MITKKQMKKAKHENVRRLARFLNLRNIDDMSDRQLRNLLHWLFTRREKRVRNLTGGWR